LLDCILIIIYCLLIYFRVGGKRMANTRYKEQILQYVLDSSNEENERLAVFIARMRDEGRGFPAAREKSAAVSGEGLRQEEQDGAVSGRGCGRGCGAFLRERP
jgi:signal transduction histidine kinase